MATQAQVKFFENLTNDKDFGDKSIPELRATFNALDDRSASVWIEKALKLPKRPEGDANAPVTAPPF